MKIAKQSLLFCAILVLISTSARAQKLRPPDNYRSLYSKALLASLETMSKAFGKLDLTERGSRMRIDFHKMIIRKNPAITDELPLRFGKYCVSYLDNQSLINRWKRVRKGFAVLAVDPAEKQGERLRIRFTLSWVRYQKAILSVGVDSWVNVYFRYDETKQEYVVENVELAGV